MEGPPPASSTGLPLTFWKPQRTAVYGCPRLGLGLFWAPRGCAASPEPVPVPEEHTTRLWLLLPVGRGARAVVPPAVALGGDRRRGVSRERMEEDCTYCS